VTRDQSIFETMRACLTEDGVSEMEGDPARLAAVLAERTGGDRQQLEEQIRGTFAEGSASPDPKPSQEAEPHPAHPPTP